MGCTFWIPRIIRISLCVNYLTITVPVSSWKRFTRTGVVPKGNTAAPGVYMGPNFGPICTKKGGKRRYGSKLWTHIYTWSGNSAVSECESQSTRVICRICFLRTSSPPRPPLYSFNSPEPTVQQSGARRAFQARARRKTVRPRSRDGWVARGPGTWPPSATGRGTGPARCKLSRSDDAADCGRVRSERQRTKFPGTLRQQYSG